MIEKIYSGYAVNLRSRNLEEIDPDVDIAYEISDITVIEKLKNGIYHVKGCWCTSPYCSTSYLSDNDFDYPIELKYGYVFYSKERSKCFDFVNKCKKSNEEFIDKINKFRKEIEWSFK